MKNLLFAALLLGVIACQKPETIQPDQPTPGAQTFDTSFAPATRIDFHLKATGTAIITYRSADGKAQLIRTLDGPFDHSIVAGFGTPVTNVHVEVPKPSYITYAYLITN